MQMYINYVSNMRQCRTITTKFWLAPGLALQHHTHDSCSPTGESITPSLEYRDACVCMCEGGRGGGGRGEGGEGGGGGGGRGKRGEEGGVNGAGGEGEERTEGHVSRCRYHNLSFDPHKHTYLLVRSPDNGKLPGGEIADAAGVEPKVPILANLHMSRNT